MSDDNEGRVTEKVKKSLYGRGESMYAHLLRVGLELNHGAGESSGELLAKLLVARRHYNPDSVAVSQLMSHLAYDAALVRFARSVGLECDLHGFGMGGVERGRIEEALSAKGIRWDAHSLEGTVAEAP